MKVDITIQEALCLPLQNRAILRTYDGFSDLPQGPTVKVYALEEVMVEKLLALSGKARNEPRDLYDLWHLFTSTPLRLGELQAEIGAKLALRKRSKAGLGQAIAIKEDRLRKLWEIRLAHQVLDLPGNFQAE